MNFTAILRRPRPWAFALLLATVPALAQPQKSSQDQLPEMGTAAQAALSLEDESQIGRMVMRNLREAGMVLDDPEVHEYIQSLGLRLSSLAQDGNRNFNFFVVRDPAINAFALPGGYVGIHSGLMLETRNESELAGVLAHEVAHVTQRHIARGLEAQSRANLMTTAAMLAAILVGAAGGGSSDVTMGAITAAQNMAAQAGINFTRDNEYEADRIGIGVLAAAGFRSKRDAGVLRHDVPPHPARPGPGARVAAHASGHQQPHRGIQGPCLAVPAGQREGKPQLRADERAHPRAARLAQRRSPRLLQGARRQRSRPVARPGLRPRPVAVVRQRSRKGVGSRSCGCASNTRK